MKGAPLALGDDQVRRQRQNLGPQIGEVGGRIAQRRGVDRALWGQRPARPEIHPHRDDPPALGFQGPRQGQVAGDHVFDGVRKARRGQNSLLQVDHHQCGLAGIEFQGHDVS